MKNGQIKNPLHKSVFNVGFIGISNNTVNRLSKSYNFWNNMLRRCYSDLYHCKKPTYKGCIVTKKWHNFQNFSQWFKRNYIEGFVLDKDILIKGNKIYSPETCCFVPSEINTLLIKCNSKRGLYPIDVSLNKNSNNFESYFTKNKVKIHLGRFSTSREAFQAYKITKEKYIKQVADKWKSQITPEVYQALCNYQIEIND